MNPHLRAGKRRQPVKISMRLRLQSRNQAQKNQPLKNLLSLLRRSTKNLQTRRQRRNLRKRIRRWKRVRPLSPPQEAKNEISIWGPRCPQPNDQAAGLSRERKLINE